MAWAVLSTMNPSDRQLLSKLSRVALVALCTCLVLIQAPDAVAANQPNGKCPSLGKIITLNGTKYTCTKNGINQTWIKILKLTKEDSNLEALFNGIKIKMDSAQPNFKVSIYRDPKLNKSLWAKDSVVPIESALKLLQVLGVESEKEMKIYLSWGGEYRNLFLPDYCRYSAGGGACGQTGILFADFKWFATNWGYGGNEKPYKSDMDKFMIAANIPHEIGHYGQTEIAIAAGNTDYWKYAPPWLREGGGEYFKLITIAYDRKVTYKTLHDLYLSNAGDRCGTLPLSKMTEQDSKTDGCEYNKGLFAVEYLTLKAGRVDALFLMNTKTGTDTAQIFQEAYGFSLAEFNKEADAYYSKLLASLK